MALVLLPGPLAALYPDGERRTTIDGATVGALLDSLDRRWPGLVDRLCEPGPVVRPYIRLFVNGEPADLATPVDDSSTVHVLLAIAGG